MENNDIAAMQSVIGNYAEHNDSASILGRLNKVEKNIGIKPYIENDVLIDGNSFVLQHEPILLGDTYSSTGTVTIIMEEISPTQKIVEEWAGLSFDGNIGTLEGANGRYDKKRLFIPYFFNDIENVNYRIVMDDGIISVEECRASERLNKIVIEDSTTKHRYSIDIGKDGEVIIMPTREPKTNRAVNSIHDRVQNKAYAPVISMDMLEWREYVEN